MALTKVTGGVVSTTTNLNVGVVTATKFVGGVEITSGNIVATAATFSGNVSVAGTLTYQDVTNVDSIGVGTFQSNVQVGAGISVVGVSTFSGNVITSGDVQFTGDANNAFWDKSVSSLQFSDNAKATWGDHANAGDLQIYHDGSASRIVNNTGLTYLQGDVIRFRNQGDSATLLNASTSGVDLYAGTGLVLQTTAPGVVITGVSTFSGDIDANADIELAGNLAVTGVSTFTAAANFDDAITVDGSVGIADSIIHLGNTDTSVRFPSDDTFAVETAGSEALRITSAGKVLIGATSARVESNGFASPLQVEGTATATSSVVIARNSANASSSQLIFQKSRGTSVGSNTVIQSGDAVGTIIFEGSDGTNTDPLASIIGACDGTPGTNDVPGRLVFSTTADGDASPTERMRINKAGRLLLGTSIDNVFNGNRNARFQQEGLNAADAAFALCRHSADTGPAFISLGKTRGTDFAVNTAVQDGDGIGCIEFNAGDGSGALNTHAKIIAEVDGTPGNSDAPGRIVFYTTPDGGSTTPAERLRITSAGALRLSDTVSPNDQNTDIWVASDVLNFNAYGTNGAFIFKSGSSSTERLRITSAGKVGVNTTANLNAGLMTLYSANVGEGTATGQLELKDNAAFGSTPTGGIIFSGHHTTGSQAIFAGIRGFKANTGDGDLDGCLAFDVRKHGAVAYEAMRIDEDGRVGIGTIPVAGEGTELAIRSSDGQTNVGLIPNTNSESSQLTFYNAANNSAQGYIRYDNSDNSLQFRVNLAERFRIEAGGNIGIGTNNPNKQVHIEAATPFLRLEDNTASSKRLDLWVESSDGFIGVNQSAQKLHFQTIGTTRLTIDNNGKLLAYGGLTASSLPTTGNAADAAIHVRGTNKFQGIAFGASAMSATVGTDGTNGAIVYTGNAAPANLGGGEKVTHEWWTGSAGGGGPSHVMSLTTSGNLGIGTSAPGALLHTWHATSNTCATFESGDAGAGINLRDPSQRSSIEQNGTDFIFDADPDGNFANSQFRFKVDNSTKLEIGTDGHLYNTCASSSLASLTLRKTSNSDSIDFMQCRSNSNALRMVIHADGDVNNQDNSYGQTSDVKLKENIVDANSQWADIKAIKVRNFNFKASTGMRTHKQIGVVAQEIETVSAGLVSEFIDRNPDTGEDLGTTTKSVKYSVLYMKAIKALQESMSRIETLEAKVASLESS